MLDEDGRCKRTGLLPDGCGCPNHRDSKDFAAEKVLMDYGIVREVEARYGGRCSLNAQHTWEPGDTIAMGKRMEDDVEIGWICKDCITGAKS